MANKEIVIVATGMVTSVGFNSEQTAANVRAKVSRYYTIPFLNCREKPHTVAVVARDALGELPEPIARRDYFTRRQGLLLRLTGVALRDCVKEVGKRAGLPPLFFAMPEHENPRPVEGASVLDDLATLHPGVFDRASSQSKWKGRAGGLLALGEAIRTVQSGQTSFAYAGGSDTYIDPTILPTLDLSKRCKFEAHPDSFVPGEGAGFVLIAEREAAQKAGFEVLARVAPVTEGHEPGFWGSKEPYLGEGLATTVQTLLAAAPPPNSFAEVYSTMNGESYWAKEWGVTRIRNASAMAEDERMNHPAEFFGDVGAASGPILVALAGIGQKSGYAKSPALVYASSDFGSRAATWVAPVSA